MSGILRKYWKTIIPKRNSKVKDGTRDWETDKKTVFETRNIFNIN